jgi:drug/metabolite transporter (DMT)-like permease
VTLLASLIGFWVLQVFAYLSFKWGSLDHQRNARRWWTGFAIGNIFGAASVYFLMHVLGLMPHNPNLALVLAIVGSTLGSQLSLAVVFRSRLAWIQWAGILLAVVGTAVATLGGRG